MENGYLVNNRSQTPASVWAQQNKLWCNLAPGCPSLGLQLESFVKFKAFTVS